MVGALAVTMVIAAVISGLVLSRSSQVEQSSTLQEMVHAAGPMPSWLSGANSSIVAEYNWAAGHHKELQYIPCYCGCDAQGHVSNSACYFRRDRAAAIADYESHAYG